MFNKKILLIDDHPIFRAGISTLLNDIDNFEIVQFSDAPTALKYYQSNSAAVVFLDIELPGMNGLEAAKVFLKADSNCKIVILTMHRDNLYLEQAIEIGVAAYLLKGDKPEVVQNALQQVWLNQQYISPSFDHPSNVETLRRLGSEKYTLDLLSDREKEILYLLDQDMTSREIAEYLEISFRTVQNHRANIKSKLGITKNSQLLKACVSWRVELERYKK